MSRPRRKRYRSPDRVVQISRVAPSDRWVGLCPLCGKTRFTSRADAKDAARQLYPGHRMSVYRCSGYFHYGHNYRKYTD